MDNPVQSLLSQYKEMLTNQALEPALIDYLSTLAGNAMSQLHTLNSFTHVKVNMSVLVDD